MTDHVDWRYWRKQKEAMEHAVSGDFDITVFLGGYRSGKSVSGSRFIVKNALKIPNSKWLAMAVNYNVGKQTTYNVLFDMAIPGDNVNPFEGGDPTNSPVVKHWTKLDKTLTFNNGSTIVLAGADTPDRYEGGSFNGAWVDEPGNYKSKLHGVASTLLERMDRGSPGSMLWTTTGKTGALQKLVEQRKWPKTGEPFNNSIKIVKASTENNPFLSQSALNRIKRRYEGSTNEGMALHGEFGDVEGRVYDEFNRETHVKPRKELKKKLDENKKMVYGYDAGWDDERVVIQAGIANDGSVLILDEFYESEKFVEDAINWLKDRSRGKVFCEHEPEHIKKFNRQTSHRAVKANKSIDAGIDTVRNRIRKNGLMVAEECENTISEFLSYQKEDVGGTNVSDHACLVPETEIFTENGIKQLGDVGVGEKVLTRNGFKPVEAKMRRPAEVMRVKFSNGRELVGTPDHPVMTEDGWVGLGALNESIKAYSLNNNLWHQTKKLTKSNTKTSNSEDTLKATTLQTKDTIGRTEKRSSKELKHFTERNIKTNTEAYPKTITSTTKMVTQQTTTSPTSKPFQKESTYQSMQKNLITSEVKNSEKILKKLKKKPRNGIDQRKVVNGIENMGKKYGRIWMPKPRIANTVETSLSTTQMPGFVLTNVKQGTGMNPESMTKKENVSSAEKLSHVTNTRQLNTVHVNAAEKLQSKRDVVNLKVKDDAEYFANSILTHNCDVVRYMCMGLEKGSTEFKRKQSPFAKTNSSGSSGRRGF